MEDLKCQDCKECKPDVKETACPFVQEIYDKIEMVTICGDCYYERCQDI